MQPLFLGAPDGRDHEADCIRRLRHRLFRIAWYRVGKANITLELPKDG